jgi:hypothetical protein
MGLLIDDFARRDERTQVMSMIRRVFEMKRAWAHKDPSLFTAVLDVLAYVIVLSYCAL